MSPTRTRRGRDVTIWAGWCWLHRHRDDQRHLPQGCPVAIGLDVEALLEQLTLQEKASLTSGSGFWYTVAIERLGIPKIMVSDGPHGLRAQPGAGDHIGLGTSLPATCFPTASAIASAWNPELLQRIGAALAQEARAINLSVILGPGINMKRSPLCGRNFEYFSEDPYLAGELGVGIVEGIQSHGVGTSVKHYAANNQESDRQRVDAQVDERTLREIYLPAFERIVTACQPWTIMCSYNKVNGLAASENPWLLTTVLREEWGYTGLMVSDWGAVYHRVPALKAGLDLEMPPNLPRSVDQIVAAVRSGDLDEQVLDARVRTVLELVDKGMGVLDLDEDFDADAHHQLARAAAAESVVLLKNDPREDGTAILPLAPGSRIAVVGEFARTPRYQGAAAPRSSPRRWRPPSTSSPPRSPTCGSRLAIRSAKRATTTPWLGGQAAGGAIADVLSGRVNPAGRLAETVPHRLEDNSSYLNFPGDSQVVRYGEGLFIGYRGYDKAATDVAYPFGFGLSYTTFELSDLQVAMSGSVAEDDLAAEVTLTVTNTGPVAGADVCAGLCPRRRHLGRPTGP